MKRLTHLVMVLALLGCAYGQKVIDPFENVPVEKRESLLVGVNKVVKATITKNWGELYDLLGDFSRMGLRRDEFIQRANKEPGLFGYYGQNLTGFVVDGVTQDVYVPPDKTGKQTKNPNFYLVVGCARIGRWLPDHKQAVIQALFENGQWRFSVIEIQMESVDGPPQKCRRRR